MGRYKRGKRLWTKEQDDFIIENVPKLGIKKTMILLNQLFCTTRSYTAISIRAHKHGLHVPSEIHSAHFKTNTPNPYKTLELGEEYRGTRFWYVKVKDEVGKSGYGNWKQKHRVIWEMAHGQIPKDHVICFADGDTFNCELTNLRCIPRKYVSTIGQRGWMRHGPEMLDAGIAWCDLHYALEEVRRK